MTQEYKYPFVTFVDEGGNLVHAASTYIPVRFTNPHSGLSCTQYALIDTGADRCAVPQTLAVDIGHDFRGDRVKTDRTFGVSGDVDMFMHTFDIEILTPDRSDVFVSIKNTLVACVETEIPALLGVEDCLGRFLLTIDYPQREIVLRC